MEDQVTQQSDEKQRGKQEGAENAEREIPETVNWGLRNPGQNRNADPRVSDISTHRRHSLTLPLPTQLFFPYTLFYFRCAVYGHETSFCSLSFFFPIIFQSSQLPLSMYVCGLPTPPTQFYQMLRFCQSTVIK